MQKIIFADVAGKTEVVRLLLKSGANPSTVNNLGKTASMMAAFVGELVGGLLCSLGKSSHVLASQANTRLLRLSEISSP